MLLLSFALACLSQAQEFSFIQVGKKLRKCWHEAPLLYVNYRCICTLKEYSEYSCILRKERDISGEKFTHAAPCTETTEDANKDESEDEAGALRKTYTLVLSDISRQNGEIDEA